jgi:hypothetical protein
MEKMLLLPSDLGPTLISISSSANIAIKATSSTLSLCLSSLCVAGRGIAYISRQKGELLFHLD